MDKNQELCWAKFEAGSLYPMHSHSYEQASVIVRGRMHLTVGEESRKVAPGDMWFTPADMPHGRQLLGDEPFIFIDVYAPPSRGDDTEVAFC